MPYLDLVFTSIILVISAYTDFKKRKIYNSLTLPFIPIGIINTLSLYGVEEGLTQCLWLIPAFILCFLLFKLHQIGGGDGKLILAVGSLMGLSYTLVLLAITFILGWFYALNEYIQRKKTPQKEKERILIPLASVMLGGFIILNLLQLIK